MMRKTIALTLALTLVLALSLSATGCAAGGSNEFRVGLECGYAPFNWTQTDASNGAVQISGTSDYAGGYDVEVAKLIAKGLGKKLVIVKTSWDGLVPALQSGTIDAIIAGMSPTADRKQTIDFTANYYRSELVLVVKKGGKYESATSLADFSGAKVTAQLNTFHYTVIEQITGVLAQTAKEDFPSMRVALEAGSIDAYVSERPEGVSAAAANPNFVMIQFASGKGFATSDDDVAVAVGLKKGQADLITKIDKVLAGLSEAQRTALMDTAIVNQPSSN